MEEKMTTFSFHPALKLGTNVPATLDFNRPFVGQVQGILESAGSGLMDRDGEVVVTGQAVAAILMIAGLEMVRGLPKLTLFSLGQNIERVGVLDLGDYRHNVVRARRNEIPSGEAFAGYTVIDGSGRGITDIQRVELAEKFGLKPEEVRVVDAGVGQIDFTDPTAGLVHKLVNTGLNVSDWAARRLVYLPAGSGLAAAIQAVTMHGLGESWIPVIRLNKGEDGVFHVAEICDPQEMRQWGTAMVAKWTSDKSADALKSMVDSVNAGDGLCHVEFEGNTLIFTGVGTPTVKVIVTSAEFVS